MSNKNTEAALLRNSLDYDGHSILSELPDMLVVTDVASLLHLKSATVRVYLGAGVLPGIKIGRRWYVPKAHLLDFIESGLS
ncbi:MAG: helix-turn-helix domain-containing protein [Coriobacteriales bacterium]|jgi:excisionase family DNA binding protein|nr:helix-turn-helix domain-containing protein [Coriobacteriales bacterium]